MRYGAVTLASLAALCVGMVGATAAMGVEGEFVNKEGAALVKNKFTATIGEARLETKNGTKVICKAGVAHGKLTSRTGGEETLLFKECTSGGLSCKGGEDALGKAAKGEIIIDLSIQTRVAGHPEGEVLLQFAIAENAENPKGVFTFSCSGLALELKGGFLTPTGTQNVLKNAWSFIAKQTKSVQEPNEFENEAKEKITSTLEMNVESLGFEHAGVQMTQTAMFEEEGEFVQGVLILAVSASPIEFPKGITSREITLINTGTLEITFKNGTTGKPGEISLDPTNFTIGEIPANKCGATLAAGFACAISVTSAKEGEKGEYKLEWGNTHSTKSTTRELKS